MSCCGEENSVHDVTPPAAKVEALVVSKEAVDYVMSLLNKEPEKKGWGLKIEVSPGGCAGYKYEMNFQEKAEPEEKTYEFHGLKIFLNLMSSALLKGSSVQYVSSLEGSGLKIENPNMTRSCGCGKSFS